MIQCQGALELCWQLVVEQNFPVTMLYYFEVFLLYFHYLLKVNVK